jgi:nucleoside transporter
MAEGVGTLNATPTNKPPLELGVRLRLSIMMFLQFAVWGGWFVVFGNYVLAKPSEGGLGFNGTQTGSLYGTMALGAILSTMVAGQLADRFVASEFLMAAFHLAGAVLLYAMAHIHSFGALWWTTLAYALVYNPTLAVSNSLAFANIPDATRDFPTLRVLGTIGWIVANMAIDIFLPAGALKTNKPLIMAAVLSAVLGVFSFVLPHTPPSGKKGDALPFLRAFKLLAYPSFGIFFGISFIITIALAFYYAFAAPFLQDLNFPKIPTVMSLGQWSEIFFMLALPFALKRLGMKWVLGVGMAAWAVRYGLFALQHPAVFIIVAVALHGVCFDFFLAAGFIYTDNKAPAAIRGSAQALFSFLVYGVGMWIGNTISGVVVDKFTVNGVHQWSKIWLVPAVGAAVCLALFLVLWRDTEGKVQDEPGRDFAGEMATEVAASPKDPNEVSQTAG